MSATEMYHCCLLGSGSVKELNPADSGHFQCLHREVSPVRPPEHDENVLRLELISQTPRLTFKPRYHIIAIMGFS